MTRSRTATRARFEELRARYITAKAKCDELDGAFKAKYGSDYQPSWLKVGERATEKRAGAALDKAGDAFTAHLATFSPRDWSYGVPCQWVRENLTFEDATRPVEEPLSVVPPLSYGAARART